MEHKNESRLTSTLQDKKEFTDLESLWEAALGEIELQISRPNFVTWFKNSQLIDKKEQSAYIALPNTFAKEWIENKYAKIVFAALRNLDGSITKIEFIVNNSRLANKLRSKARQNKIEITQQSFPEFRIDPETNLNPRYNYANFVVGKANELAHAATSAVVSDIGSKYNPLFLYGGVGLGKTHLVQALGNEIKRRYKSSVRVKYVSSEKFTNDVIWAIRNKRTETIKEKYRLVDVLIIDDIQFIIGKPSTEEEFFHTFNALYESNKQIIISSDKPPKFMPDLAERLRSRFEGGMIVDVGPPDYELRFAILKSKLEEKGVGLSDDVIGLIANKIQKNFRELEGVINRISFYQNIKKSDINAKIAEEIIAEIIQEPIKNISPSVIIKTVAESFDISLMDITGQCRKKEVVEPRQIAMFLLRDMLSLSYPTIGEKMGKRDHTTAIYAFEKINKEMAKNQNLNQKVLLIKEVLGKE
ncbi:MAG: chromosomal replication initiator protein DnaA [bacterium]|nr:chromosomal replication initiator protein DnaA [bacterium]